MKILSRFLPLLLVVGIAGLTTPAAAEGAYGALATSPDADYGYAYNYGTQDEASRRAMAECSKHSSACSIKGTFENVCVSLARAGNGAMGWAWGHGRREDDGLAMQECEKNRGNNCTLAVRFCTGTP